MDDAKIILSVVAIFISIISFYFSRKSWLQSNRPIVTAFLTESSTGNSAATFDLVVSNTGNRPATSVRIYPLQDISKIIYDDALENRKRNIQDCFSEEAAIPLLRNGEELETAFGASTNETYNGKWLKYGEQIQIEIDYFDLEGRHYFSNLPLKVYARKGFGGTLWSTGNNQTGSDKSHRSV